VYSARDRFFAELVVARGIATQEAVRAAIMRAQGVLEPGMLPRVLASAGVMNNATFADLEDETDRSKRSCTCGEIYYAHGLDPAACPRCRRLATPDPQSPPTFADLGSVSPLSGPPISLTPTPRPTRGSRTPGGPPADPGVEREQRSAPRTRYGSYQVLEELGRGGMGVVYRARQDHVNREVALKVLLEPKGKRRERFMREARAAAKLEHPNIVRIHDVGEEEGIVYYTMDFLRGQPLDRLLSIEGKLAPDKALAILEPLCLAVHEAHTHQILHRDLKPGNVLILPNGSPVLIDFGLARALDDSEEKLTRTGVAIGTPQYMSPEQVRGIRAEIDARTDVWALGVILFELIVGERPFYGDNAADLYATIQNSDAPRLRTLAPSAPASVEAIVAKALDRDKTRRYQSAKELAEEIGRIRRGEAAMAMGAGERLGRAGRRAGRRARKLVVFAIVGVIALVGSLIYKVVAARKAREQLAINTAKDRERVQAHATSLIQKVRGQAAEAANAVDGKLAREQADEAVTTLDTLAVLLAKDIDTEGGREEAGLQAKTPEAASALRQVLTVRARVCLKNPATTSFDTADADLARVRKDAPDDAELAALHGEALVGLERGEDAERAIAGALAAHPADPALRLVEARAKLVEGDCPAAIAAATKLLEASPQEARARLSRAQAYLRSGDAAHALEDAGELDKGATAHEARALAIEAEVALGKLDQAFVHATELVRSKGDERVAALAFAVMAEARGDDEAAIRVLGAAIQKRPEDPDLLAARARAHIALLHDDEGPSDLRAAADHAPSPLRRVALRLELAALEEVIGRGDDAAKDVERALQAARDDVLARGLVHVGKARRALAAQPPVLDTAADEVALAGKDTKSVPGLASVQAWLALERGEGAPALEAAQKVRARDPRDLLAASVELGARRLQGDKDLAALAAEVAALEDSVADAAGLLARRAALRLRFASYARVRPPVLTEAAKRATRAIALAPRRAVACAIAAGAALSLRTVDEARQAIALALAWNPDHPLVAYWQGRIELAAKNGKAALPALEKAVALSPGDLGTEACVWTALAQARVQGGDFPGGETAANKAIELDPSSLDGPMVRLLAEAKGKGDPAAVRAAFEAVQRSVNDTRQKARQLAEKSVGFTRSNQSEKALEAAEEAARLDPNSLPIWTLLWSARNAASSGQQVAGFAAFIRMLEIEPYPRGSDPEDAIYAAISRYSGQMSSEAVTTQAQALVDGSKRAPEAHFLMGYIEWGRLEFHKEKLESQLDRAIAHLDDAIVVDRRFAVAYALRGHLKRLRGEVGTARDDFDCALALVNGRMPVVHVYRAGLEASIGDRETAIVELTTAVKSGFQDKARIMSDPVLASLDADQRVHELLKSMPEKPDTGFSDW
jgi:tetratricopeptide (TPR) repeat protein/predicted Ser/Thr protein kinase